MNLLLDTHAFIWLMEEPRRVPQRVRDACEDPSNSLLLSLVSIWEMQIKLGSGKLKFARPLRGIVESEVAENSIELLSLQLPHLWELDNLPHRHSDPFDRMLIAQARVENLLMVSDDKMFANYPINTFW